MRVLSASDVDRISRDFDPLDLQYRMAQVFLAVSRPDEASSNPHRSAIKTDNQTLLFMPARLGEDTAIKIVSVPHESNPGGLPATTVVMDEETGSAKAIVNARRLTALRNAAGMYSPPQISTSV